MSKRPIDKSKNTEAGEPLTLEQLREMDGQPVWVDFTGGTIKMEPGWFILIVKPDREVYLAGKVSIYRAFEDYGETWRAYTYSLSQIGRRVRVPCFKCSQKCYFCIFNESAKCRTCKDYAFNKPMFRFCPECGRPLTKEA